jgi:hypothetical protein
VGRVRGSFYVIRDTSPAIMGETRKVGRRLTGGRRLQWVNCRSKSNIETSGRRWTLFHPAAGRNPRTSEVDLAMMAQASQ